jgi:hypothetical protein
VRFGEAHAAENGLLTANWHLGGGARLWLTANLSDQTLSVPSRENPATPIWGEAADTMKPWSVLWRMEAR